MTGTGARFGLNMISAISAQGALRFAVLAGTLTAAGFIDFLNRLLHDAQRTGAGPVFVIVDGPTRCTGPRRWTGSSPPLEGRCGCTGCRPTPRNSTQTSWVWTNVKADGMAPAAPHGPDQLHSVVVSRLRRLQRLPHIVRGFFADPELAYTATS